MALPPPHTHTTHTPHPRYHQHPNPPPPFPTLPFHWRRIRNADKEKQTLAASPRRAAGRGEEIEGMRQAKRGLGVGGGVVWRWGHEEDRRSEAEWEGSRRGYSTSGTQPRSSAAFSSLSTVAAQQQTSNTHTYMPELPPLAPPTQIPPPFVFLASPALSTPPQPPPGEQ